MKYEGLKSRLYNAYKHLICIIVLLLQFDVSNAQVSLPLDVPTIPSATATLYSGSLKDLISYPSIIYTYPNAVIVNELYSGYKGSDIENAVWGPLIYKGYELNINFKSKEHYFDKFVPGKVVLQQYYSLKVYAPGDSFRKVPIFVDDSVLIEMRGGTPEVNYKMDLGPVLANYIPLSGLGATVDSTDTLSFVHDLYTSISEARDMGVDSIVWDSTMISLDSALALADSADFANRGISSGAALNKGLAFTYTLELNPRIKSILAAGLDIGQISVLVSGTVRAQPAPWWHHHWPCDFALHTTGVVQDNPVIYTWDDCPFYNYEVQVLRLFNTSPSYANDEHHIKAVVDWSQALDLETNNGQRSIRLTNAEGTGFYVWRVRRIYDYYPNTIGDNRNWGSWTYTGPFVDGNTVDVDMSMLNNYLFFDTMFNDTLNWTYQRKFAEGEIDHGSQLRVQEGIQYADYNLHPVQRQVKMEEANTVIASQTIPDNSGRATMNTIPSPIGKYGLEYEYNYVLNAGGTSYTADDYDLQSNYNNPSVVNGASKIVQYYSDANSDLQIPNADKLPFDRIVFYNDVTGRPREGAKAGQYRGLGSDHTSKAYYSGTSSMELIRLFGDEAPKSESVLKTYEVDENKVINIKYTDEITGATLATCLTRPQSLLLDTIPDNPFIVNDTVSSKVAYAAPPVNRLVETKTYTFAIPTQLSYFYQIIPDVYRDTCLNVCATCDYVVNITAYNVDDTEATHQYHQALYVTPHMDSLGGQCSSNTPYSTSGSYAVTPIGGSGPSIILDPGTYVVTASISVGNTDPYTGVPYEATANTVMLRKLQHQLWNDPGYVVGGNSGLTLTAIQGYLDHHDMNGLLAYTGADTSLPYFTYVIGCDTLMLPTEHCARHNCSTIDFSEYMISQLAQYDADHGTTTFSGITNIASTTDAANLFLVASNAEFNSVISNMIADGYDCDTLWNAWAQTVGWYSAVQGAMVPSPVADWWQHFMDIVGYKFPFVPHNASELLSAGTGVRNYPYKYFPYTTGTNATAESLFCYLYEVSIGAPTSSCTYAMSAWSAAIENFPAHQPADAFHMYNFYRNIKPSSPSYTGGLGSAGGVGFPGPSTGANYAMMEHECYESCDSRYNDLVDVVAQDYMTQLGVAVTGVPYMSWYPQPAADTIDISKVYCVVSALVSNCKAGCKLTPDPVTGIVPGNQILAYQHSMTYSMDIQVSMADSPACHNMIDTEQHTVHVLRDSVICYLDTTGVVVKCDTVRYFADSTYTVITGIDSGFITVYNTDSMFSQNDALLLWLNHQYMALYDSLHNIGYPYTYGWAPMSAGGMNTFGGAAFDCLGDSVRINPMGPPGVFSYDTAKITKDVCSSNHFTVTRAAPHVALINSTMDVNIDVTVNAGGAVSPGDSIVIIETIPTTATLVPASSNGVVSGGTIHFASAGPIAVGTVLHFHYSLQMPGTVGTAVTLNGQVERYVGGSGAICALTAATTTADSCVPLYYTVPGLKGVIRPLCNVCYTPMGCHSGVCMHYELPQPPADTVHIMTCEEFVCNNFTNAMLGQVQSIKDHHSNLLQTMYNQVCNDPDHIRDLFVNTYGLDQYQYTLFYYDRAGNLVRTVKPRGVRDSATGRFGPPQHYDVTQYDYNSLGQLIRQQTPDEGETLLWYDKKGKPRLSQDAHQRGNNAFTYTIYDDLQRIIETGQILGYSNVDTSDIYDPAFPYDGGIYSKEFVTKRIFNTACTIPLPGFGMYNSANLVNRVSYTVTDRDGNFSTTSDEVVNVYNYDVHGNVITEIQYVRSAPNAVRTDYLYAQLTGNIIKTSQCKIGTSILEDYLVHWYSYDADTRLARVRTSYASGGVWTDEASYKYYLHGPLRRHIVGNNIQGLDYTYTLEGWIKGINHSKFANDPGGDGITAPTGKDVFGMVLNYYKGDFNRSGSPFNSVSNPANLTSPNPVAYGGGDLFNGNITSWMQHVKKTTGPVDHYIDSLQVGYTYRYDQLNELKHAKFWQYTSGTWTQTIGQPFDERFTYDRNGNLQTLTRKAQDPYTNTAFMLDNLRYTYNTDGSGNPLNQLGGVSDAAGVHAGYGDVGGTSYYYDETGRLIREVSNPQDLTLKISWTPFGKVDQVKRLNASGILQSTHDYLYDAMGNQVSDIETITGVGKDTLYKIFSGSHNHIATYHMQNGVAGTGRMGITERYLYGQERLGTIKGSNVIGTGVYITWVWTWTPWGWVWLPFIHYTNYIWGPSPDKQYELHDHLGNVRSTVASVLLPGGQANVLSYNNYYAFGSQQPYRNNYTSGYTFGFNGKEKKDDWRGVGNSYDFGARNFDARIGRFIMIDPIAKMYPEGSPYEFAANRPIDCIDQEGLKVRHYSPSANSVIIYSRKTAASFEEKGEGGFRHEYLAAKKLNMDVLVVEDLDEALRDLARIHKKYTNIINSEHGTVVWIEHPSYVGFWIGKDFISTQIVLANKQKFVTLGSYIKPGGSFVLTNCMTANNSTNEGDLLLPTLSSTMNTVVYGHAASTPALGAALFQGGSQYDMQPDIGNDYYGLGQMPKAYQRWNWYKYRPNAPREMLQDLRLNEKIKDWVQEIRSNIGSGGGGTKGGGGSGGGLRLNIHISLRPVIDWIVRQYNEWHPMPGGGSQRTF